MKKIITTIVFCCTFAIIANAQAILPATWGFTTTTLPTGWTDFPVGGAVYYAASGNPSPAYKFPATGTMLIINFNSNPGALTYDIAANGAGTTANAGVFLVEESTNGTIWTTLRTVTPYSLTSTYGGMTDTPNLASRYIRFNYANKVLGNIGIDNVSIAVGAAGPTATINVTHNGATLVNNTTYVASSPVSTALPVTFKVHDVGTLDSLFISSATITGPDAADFIISTIHDTVPALDSADLVVTFTPSVAGTRHAVLTINNNDASNNPYILNLYGIGGNLATEPTTQGTGLVFSNVKSYTFDASFVNAFPMPEGYVVLRKIGSTITDMPVDGVTYLRGDYIGTSQVVYSGSATSFTPNHIVANTNYYFQVFSYNGPTGYRNYYTTSPLAANVTTLGSMQPATYYIGVNTADATFEVELHSKIRPHTHLYYSDYGADMVPPFIARDTTGNQRAITCAYSGEVKVYTEPFDWTTEGFSREHTFCHQWMPTYPNTTGPEYEDYHQLFQVDQNGANAPRSNYPLGEVVTVTSSFFGCKLGTDANGHVVFEPRDAQKGASARALMYEATCYDSLGNWHFPNPISGSITYGEDQNVLKKWHFQFPPDNYEIARNDYIQSIQGNRNPFVDSARYACYIDFTNMHYISTPIVPCINLGVNEHNKEVSNLYIAPNPANQNVSLYLDVNNNQSVNINIYDATGNLALATKSTLQAGHNKLNLDISTLRLGFYHINLQSEKINLTQKLVIQ